MSKTSTEVFPLCQHMDALVDELRRRAPDALQAFDEDAIHKARVATRRLKAALELLNSVLDHERARPFARLGRKLRRRLGPLRDIDVMIGHLDEIKPGTRLAPAVQWLRKTLLDDRERARASSANKPPAEQVLTRLGAWWGVRQDVIEAKPAVRALLAESVHVQLDQFAENAQQLASSHDPHQLRISGKSLRYTLEIAQKEGIKLPAMILRTFKRLQDRLGSWHDFVVLAERAMQAGLDQHLALHDPPMQKGMLNLVEHATRRAQQELDRFSILWSKEGPQLAETIRAAFALTHEATPPAAIELQRGPDPAGSAPVPAPGPASSDLPPAA